MHNICINNHLPLIDNNDDEYDENDLGLLNSIQNDPNVNRIDTELMAGKRMQQLMINTYFNI